MIALASPERALTEWAQRLLGLPFVWGLTDCGSLALAAQRVLGRPTPTIAAYTSRRGAVAAWDALPAGLGAQPVALTHLQIGDLVWHRRIRLPSFYVFLGRRLLSAKASDGVTWYTLRALADQPGLAALRF